jgi:hypothetical protein
VLLNGSATKTIVGKDGCGQDANNQCAMWTCGYQGLGAELPILGNAGSNCAVLALLFGPVGAESASGTVGG